MTGKKSYTLGINKFAADTAEEDRSSCETDGDRDLLR
jgi:hypothetical protein